jgi:hypothetical protein
LLVDSIKAASVRVNAYFWRLSGDEPNSLCRLLGMEEEELKVILHLCKIYIGDKDNLLKKNFDSFLNLCCCEHTTYRLKKQLVWLIKVGNGNSVTVPKDMYDANGCLSYYPIEEEHFRVVRTKSQRGKLPMLVNLGNKQAASEAEEAENKASNNNNKKIYTSPKSVVLYDFIAKLVYKAGASGDGKISARSARQLECLVVACVQEAAKDILHAALEKYAAFDKQSAIDYEPAKSLQSPERVTSANITATVAVTPLQAKVLTVVDEEDDPIVEEGTTNTTDDFILELKEEVVLQTLLHK